MIYQHLSLIEFCCRYYPCDFRGKDDACRSFIVFTSEERKKHKSLAEITEKKNNKKFSVFSVVFMRKHPTTDY